MPASRRNDASSGTHASRSSAGAAPDGRSSGLHISLAQWSLHRTLRAGQLDHLDFPAHARTSFGLGAVEYVNSFFAKPPTDAAYVATLRRRADDAGVRSLLIMCDGLGRLGDPDEAARRTAVERHRPWIDAAVALGCHAIRVNAASAGARDEQAALAADGLRHLCDHGHDASINVIVENHGGWSSDGSWLADVMRRVDHPRVGTLPDFGNFRIDGRRQYDHVQGVTELMPWARAVSAKSYDFDPETGDETRLDYPRLMAAVRDAGYEGWVGVEYEGGRLSEADGIRATITLLQRLGASTVADATAEDDR